MGINTGGTSEIHGCYDIDELLSDDCMRAIMEMNQRGRIAYENRQIEEEKSLRRERVKLIVDNTQVHD